MTPTRWGTCSPCKGTVDLLKREATAVTLASMIVQTSTQSIITYGVFFDGEFTAGKSNCGRVATAYHWEMGTSGPARDRQLNSSVDVFALVCLQKAVISNSHCITSYRKRYAVWPTAFVSIMIFECLLRFSLEYFLLFLLVHLTYWRHCVSARLTQNN